MCEHDGWQVAMDLVENEAGFESILCRSIIKHTSHEADPKSPHINHTSRHFTSTTPHVTSSIISSSPPAYTRDMTHSDSILCKACVQREAKYDATHTCTQCNTLLTDVGSILRRACVQRDNFPITCFNYQVFEVDSQTLILLTGDAMM